MQGKKLFVGGLSWDTTEDSMRQAFEAFGPVTEAQIILDRDTGRSRGFGFVSYDDSASAEAAMQGMDGVELDGRQIRVSEARAHERRDGGGGGGGGGGGYGGGRRDGGGGRGGRPGRGGGRGGRGGGRGGRGRDHDDY